MLDLAILMEQSPQAATVETNHGVTLSTSDWPHDCEFQIVAFDPSRSDCEVVWCEDLASDILAALTAIEKVPGLIRHNPGWYRRLKLYGEGARDRELRT